MTFDKWWDSEKEIYYATRPAPTKGFFVDMARNAFNAGRDAAIEECARVVESIGRPVGAGDGNTYVPGTSSQAAAAIRSLKSKA